MRQLAMGIGNWAWGIGHGALVMGNTNLMGRCTYFDPPKSPLRRGTLI
ncbi:MAG: hypothetical protein QQW96_24010 [Tychonema bourrellyi B0820]|nr:hypothetical protein [Tychonema bourrellyi]MDQ2100697.1 hypothetical protein [Tychonema bourrellyi B0820]